MSEKSVYLFREGNAQMRDLLGGKGANLSEMTNIGLPVPPGFTVTTEVCIQYLELNALPEGAWDEILAALADMEQSLGKKLGDSDNPLLLSVRSGARISMPGMMDTILNLGLNADTLQAVIRQTDNERFAYDSYRRFIMMFSDVVMADGREALYKQAYEEVFDGLKEERGAKNDLDVDADGMRELCDRFLAHYKEQYGADFPTDPREQLRLAIAAVFRSWNNDRAAAYRDAEGIPHDFGTGVNVQSMVFGNQGDDCGTGVAFTRNPANGENVVYGEYLMNAQGEDVVAGVRTPLPIAELEQQNPQIYQQFEGFCRTLEQHYREMQDIEFTIEHGRLFILQCRSGKRTGAAAVKIAVDMAKENLITKQEALLRVTADQLDQCLHPQIDPAAEIDQIAEGLPASPGAASGIAVFSAEVATRRGKNGDGEDVILVRPETNPDDLRGMLASNGILTERGGMTSHAALVARGFGLPAVVGAEMIAVDTRERCFRVDEQIIREGDQITIDGTTGRVIKGRVDVVPPSMAGEFGELLEWADEFRRLGIRTNADTPEDTDLAVRFGAEGIGLCRTEHMFFAEERRPIVQEMILAAPPTKDELRTVNRLETELERASDVHRPEIQSELDRARARHQEYHARYQGALDKLLPFQKEDFVGIFEALEGRPCTIRLIDPPLHEFLPSLEELLVEVAQLRIQQPDSAELGEREVLLHAVEQLHEQNPMLGLRGCRLSILFPEIVEMQARAIAEAAVAVKQAGDDVHPEVMIPLVGHVNELRHVRSLLESVVREITEQAGVDIPWLFGTMIEVPRAALTADEIAPHAQFFSFGTNDLTQMTFGYSRDDAEGKFLATYLENGILPSNPFESLDINGVGRLMRICVDQAREVNPGIKLGICGEHGGDPDSIKLCHELGLDYVSCSPYRVPVARLAAAHAALLEQAPSPKT